MRLDYGTQISPVPITLSVGVLRKPTLKEIAKLTFDRFTYYEYLIKMTPKIYYTELQKENGGKEYWESLTEEQQENITLYNLILEDEKLCNTYVEILNFFFVESVIFREGYFILLRKEVDNIEDIDTDSIRGAISKELLPQVFELIQQICCIYNAEDEIDESKFKNNLAKKLMERMKKAAKQNAPKKSDLNLTIPNIISAISNKHPSLNYTNIWNLTVFQLLDAFNRTQMNSMYDIDSTRVSVWGDEKKTFDVSLWYKNEYDKK